MYLTVVLLLLVAWQPVVTIAAPLHVLDMSYVMDNTTQFWGSPYQRAPNITGFARVMGIPTYWNANNIVIGEHVGTHIDAPTHITVSNRTHTPYSLEAMPLEHLFGPAVRIDVREQVENHSDNNYAISISDLEEHEERYGEIPQGALVFTCTGWAKYWNDSSMYFGGNRNVLGTWNSPGWSEEATHWLIDKRNIKGIAADTASCDIGDTTEFLIHTALLSRNLWCMENVASTCDLPPSGATAYALPLKFRGATGFPARVMATWSREVAENYGMDVDTFSGVGRLKQMQGLVVLSVFCLLVY